MKKYWAKILHLNYNSYFNLRFLPVDTRKWDFFSVWQGWWQKYGYSNICIWWDRVLRILMFLVYIRSIQSSSSERWPWEEGNCTHLLIPTCPSKLLMKIWRKFELHSHSFQFKSYNLQLGWEGLICEWQIQIYLGSFIQFMKIYFWSLCATQAISQHRVCFRDKYT